VAGSGVQIMNKYSRRLVREVLDPHVSGHYEKVSFGGQGKEEELTAVERGYWITNRSTGGAGDTGRSRRERGCAGEAMLSWECLPSDNSFFSFKSSQF
jgi:hypothetical protein